MVCHFRRTTTHRHVRRSVLDLRDLGVLSGHWGEPVHIPQWKREPFVPLQTSVPQRSVLTLISSCLFVPVRAESGSSLSASDDSCCRHLPVRMAGPILPMGFPDLAAGGREADWRLLLSGDRVRLWVLALYLHPHLGECVSAEVKYPNSECQKPSFVVSFLCRCFGSFPLSGCTGRWSWSPSWSLAQCWCSPSGRSSMTTPRWSPWLPLPP